MNGITLSLDGGRHDGLTLFTDETDVGDAISVDQDPDGAALRGYYRRTGESTPQGHWIYRWEPVRPGDIPDEDDIP